MFTGLIDDVGVIDRVADTDAGRELRVRCRYDDLVAGESIAVNGACMTVRDCGPRWFTFATVVTSLDRTSIGEWSAGMHVNLERSLRAGDRMGGHIVQGHVDGVGVVQYVAQREDARLIDIALPDDLFSLLVPHGSVSVDGVSLTVNDILADNVLQISIIEYTLAHTTLGDLHSGSRVHVEGDVIGKYVRRLVTPYAEAR
ncbi:MAG: riboflavin synthase [Gemmatimonadaceae bacterium]